jgi:hypothetical protein
MFRERALKIMLVLGAVLFGSHLSRHRSRGCGLVAICRLQCKASLFTALWRVAGQLLSLSSQVGNRESDAQTNRQRVVGRPVKSKLRGHKPAHFECAAVCAHQWAIYAAQFSGLISWPLEQFGIAGRKTAPIPQFAGTLYKAASHGEHVCDPTSL